MLKKIHSVAICVACCIGSSVATDVLAMETGFASYYSDRFQGRKTASGEEYDRNRLTAAHRTLPIGSQIEVTNLNNQSSVIVTINDRGPYSGKLSIDLSYAAAKEIGLLNAGVAPVAINILNAKNSDIEKAIPSEELFEFNQLAKAEEVEEAEEEVVSPEKTTVPNMASTPNNKVSLSKKQVKSSASEKKIKTKLDNSKHKEVTASKKGVKAKKSVKSENSNHKNTAKPEKASKAKKAAKPDANKHKEAAKSGKTVKAKKAGNSKHKTETKTAVKAKKKAAH
jgi:rare lipoprotein A